ncbi:MAG: hypothetical protein RLZZ500_2580 [Bacteroidota bacterium]|jgi:hypothetical protein
MKIEIPNNLKFLQEFLNVDSKYLAKLGGYIDGSYIVDYRSVLSSKYLISGGVGSNVRFESDFRLINKEVKIVFVDPTTSIIRMFIRSIYHFFKRSQNGFYSLGELFNYFDVKKHATHKYKYLGKQYTINTVCQELSITDRFFLKLDIEGFEYELLDSILDLKDKIEGICIEFHDLNKKDNVDMLETFVRKLDFNIIGVCINELAISDSGVPHIIEISFSPKKEINWPTDSDESYYLQNSNTFKGEAVVFNYRSFSK